MTFRQHLLLHHILKGKTARAAALAAGYATATVNQNLARLMRAPAMQQQFQRHMQRLQLQAAVLQAGLTLCQSQIENHQLPDRQRLSACRLSIRIISTLQRCILPAGPAPIMPTPTPPAHTPAQLQPLPNQIIPQPLHNQDDFLGIKEIMKELNLLPQYQPTLNKPQKPTFKQKLAQLHRQKNQKHHHLA